MKHQPLSRGEKIVAGASAFVVVSLLGVVALTRSINAEPHVNFPPVPPLPSPNGLDVYIQAAHNIKTWRPPVDPGSDGRKPADPKVRAQRYGLARREAWLKANAYGFAVFRKALTLPSRRPSPRGAASGLPGPNALFRELARQKMAEANTLKLREDWNGAMQSGLDIIQLGIDAPRGGTLIDKLTGSGIIGIGRSAVEKIPGQLNAGEALAAAQRLEKLIERRVTVVEAAEEENWVRISQILAGLRTDDWRQPPLNKTMSSWLRAKTVSKRDILAYAQSSNAAIIADLKKPYSAPYVEPEMPPEIPFGEYYPMALGRYLEARERTGLHLLLLQLALQSYAAQNGAAPQQLEQLVPRYLKAIPRDIFADGAPLHYEVQGKGYRLWSVGPDAKNDGGTPVAFRLAARRDGETGLASVRPESKGDWVLGKNR